MPAPRIANSHANFGVAVRLVCSGSSSRFPSTVTFRADDHLPSSSLQMRPLLPAYYSVSNVRLLSATPPCTFKICIGKSPYLSRELTIDGNALKLLALSNGKNTVEELLSILQHDDATCSERDLLSLVDALVHERILVDGDQASIEFTNDRYSRHLLYYTLFTNTPHVAQAALSRSHVCVIGVGGIGTWVAYFLAAAGIGTLTLVDGDTIEESNLTRQVLFSEGDIGKIKADVAKKRLKEINRHVAFQEYREAVSTYSDIVRVAQGADLIVVSADRPQNLLDVVDEYSVAHGIPWIGGGYLEHHAVVGPLFVPGRTGCFACRHEDVSPHDDAGSLPLIGEINQRYRPPSFGPLNGITSSLVASEVINWLGGLNDGTTALGAELLFDIRTCTSSRKPWPRDVRCSRCSRGVA